VTAASLLARERYMRVQAAMARHGVGAVCLATPHLAAFASGARRVQVAGSGGSMPWVVVVAGAPSAVAFTTDPDGVPSWTPRTAIEPLRWNRERQIERIAALVAPTTGAVACDVFSPALVAALGGRTLVDAAPVMAAAVAPRTTGELSAIRRALGAARAGLRAAAQAVTPDETPLTAHARFYETMSANGSGFPLAEGTLRRGGRPLAADEPFGTGPVTLEFGLYVDGHAGVAGDTVASGDADLTERRRAWSEALCALAKRCRAGVSTLELRDEAACIGATQDGLLAHGLGVGIEPPHVDLGDERGARLEAGTVLVLAPVVDGFRATRAVLVTERSPRWLEPAP
jgi:Xaa-Pro aminopeptidase